MGPVRLTDADIRERRLANQQRIERDLYKAISTLIVVEETDLQRRALLKGDKCAM